MKIEALTVALRPRTAWEAVELGTALVRRHAGSIWKPWLWLTLPVFVLVNALCWSIDAIWLASLLMWWLKPAFDRVPLFVLSRAVFGDVPGTRQTLAAQWRWGARWLPAYLTWRRLGPVRSLYLPVDLLEGGRGDEARGRRSALGSPVYGVAALLTLVFINFEIALFLGAIAGVMLFVPNEFVQETAARLWNVLEAQPDWLSFTFNAIAWLATSLVEPFYVGAGFGLYLNRRTEIEGWDIEMALRRLRSRLTAAAAPLLLAIVLGVGGVAPARAQDEPPQRAPGCAMTVDAADAKQSPTLREVFDPAMADDADLQQAVKRAFEDPKVSPKRKVTRWQPKNQKEPDLKPPPLGWLGEVFALIGEYGLWVVFAALAAALLLTAPRWLNWLRDATAKEGREPGEVQRDALPADAPLPDDIPAAARRLWQAGRERDALALLYRASVEAMAQRANAVLVPGATEAHTLRASRQMPLAEDREVFARTVRTWQVAAYAHGLPSAEDFDDLLGALARRFGWAR
ncbi:MAG TPA: DUF4129 domain-containing protein [Lysobacter sp.]